MLRRFYGGVHLYDEKNATRRLAAQRLTTPPVQLILPMDMHDGAPCAPCVVVGESVQVGQAIAKPVGGGAPIHAGVSGTVVAVEPRPGAGGSAVLSVVIENDDQNRYADPLPRLPFYEELTPEEIIRRTQEAGLVDMIAPCTPTHAMLRAALGKVDTLIINGAESEPYLTADHRLMLEAPERVLTGTRILMRALGLTQAYIGVEGNKTDAVAALQGLLALRGSDIVVKTLRMRYPQGAQRQLIQRLTGRLVPPGGLPVDVGCAVVSVATVAAVQGAVVEGRALTERIVTVAGRGMVAPANWIVPIGTPAAHILDCSGGLTKETVCLLFGGPMTGLAQRDDAAPVTKGTAALLALTRASVASRQNGGACIRCGKCAAVCPMRLLPLHLNRAVQDGRIDALAQYHLDDCIACGACAYICPARIPLMQNLQRGRELCAAQEETEVAAHG